MRLLIVLIFQCISSLCSLFIPQIKKITCNVCSTYVLYRTNKEHKQQKEVSYARFSSPLLAPKFPDCSHDAGLQLSCRVDELEMARVWHGHGQLPRRTGHCEGSARYWTQRWLVTIHEAAAEDKVLPLFRADQLDLHH